MDKKKLVKVELILLAVLAVLLVSRVFKGLPLLDGEVTINDVDRAELVHKAFSISEATELNISAFGSLESTESGRSAEVSMAAYPWIVRRDDRSLVWKMDPVHSSVEEGTLLKTDDSILLDAGVYDLYYASYGSSRSAHRDRRFLGVRLGEHWTADRKHWQVALKATSGELTELDEDISEYGPAGIPNVIWTSGTMRDRRKTEQILVVDSPVDVSIYAIGEICGERGCGDYGLIENVATHEEIWKLTKQNSRPAGGSLTNYVFDGVVSLDRGIYRASFRTDGGHSYGRWHGNPPFDPVAWGATIYVEQARAAKKIRPFDVWEEKSPSIKLAPAGNGVHFEQEFSVDESVDVVLYSMGEIDGDSRYDYGWLDNLDTGELVWTMGASGTSHAGGSHDNTVSEGYVTLTPGRYELHYKSDGSHAYGDWRRDEPTHEERWGITLFTVGEDDNALSLVAEQNTNSNRAERHDVSGDVVFSFLSANNNQSYTQSIELEDDSRLHIRALGEISQSGEYDYGWIESSDDSGRLVWKMNRSNTVPAGGDERFRLFDGFVELSSGEYTIHYETDESHAFGDFRDSSPEFPEEYGMRVVLIDE